MPIELAPLFYVAIATLVYLVNRWMTGGPLAPLPVASFTPKCPPVAPLRESRRQEAPNGQQ